VSFILPKVHFFSTRRFSFSILHGNSLFLLTSYELPIPAYFLIYPIKVFRGRQGGLFLSIMPTSIVLCNFSKCLNVCPIIFHRLFLIESINKRFSPIISSASWLLYRSVQLIFCMRIHDHISNYSNAFLSISFIVRVSQPYRAILQTYFLMSLCLMLKLNFLDKNNLDFLLNADFAIPMRLLISLVSFPSPIVHIIV